jgi:hypothetical protein
MTLVMGLKGCDEQPDVDALTWGRFASPARPLFLGAQDVSCRRDPCWTRGLP